MKLEKVNARMEQHFIYGVLGWGDNAEMERRYGCRGRGRGGGEMRGPALGRDEGCTTLRMTKKLLDCSLSIAFSGKFYITCILFKKKVFFEEEDQTLE